MSLGGPEGRQKLPAHLCRLSPLTKDQPGKQKQQETLGLSCFMLWGKQGGRPQWKGVVVEKVPNPTYFLPAPCSRGHSVQDTYPEVIMHEGICHCTDQVPSLYSILCTGCGGRNRAILPQSPLTLI